VEVDEFLNFSQMDEPSRKVPMTFNTSSRYGFSIKENLLKTVTDAATTSMGKTRNMVLIKMGDGIHFLGPFET
jgi:hypothetical protein